MNFFKRLFHVGSLGESLLIYIPVTLFQRMLGLVRVLLLTWLLLPAEYCLWGLASMVFTVLAPVMTFGMNNSLTRYVSFYEAHGKLRHFYYRVLGVIVLVGLLTGLLFVLFNKPITWQFFAKQSELSENAFLVRRLICIWALINALLLSWYQGLLAFLRGMRVYRIVSAVELLFSLLFTGFVVLVLISRPTALAAVITHAGVLLFTLLMGLAALHIHVVKIHKDKVHYSSVDNTDEPIHDFGVFKRLLQFGVASLGAVVLWNVNSHISFYWISTTNESDAGIYFAYNRVANTIFMIANAAWAVLLVHVARRWEIGEKKGALYVLETAYKGIVFAIMTLAVLIYLTGNLWSLLLKDEYRRGLCLVGPLLMCFQVLANMAFMTILAKIHERPSVVAIAAALGGIVNCILLYFWIGYGIEGAAYAAAVGMFVGVGIICLAYPLRIRAGIHLSTYLMLLVPVILLLPQLWCGIVWGLVLATAIVTDRFFNKKQKNDLTKGLVHMARRAKAAVNVVIRRGKQ